MATLAQLAQSRERFLTHFRVHANISWACRVSGLPRRSLYNWLKDTCDEPGAAEFRAAFADAELEATDKLEELAWKRAMGYPVVRIKTEILRRRDGSAVLDADGQPVRIETERVTTREYNTTILMRLLAARAPDKYRERSDVQHSGPGGGPIPLSMVDEIVAAAEAS